MEKYNIFFTFFLHKNVTFFPKIFLAERFDIFPIEKSMEKYIIFCKKIGNKMFHLNYIFPTKKFFIFLQEKHIGNT
jgi:hypothetical protein